MTEKELYEKIYDLIEEAYIDGRDDGSGACWGCVGGSSRRYERDGEAGKELRGILEAFGNEK